MQVWNLVSFLAISGALKIYLYLSIASTTDALRVVYLLLASFMIPPTIEQHLADFSGKTCPHPGSLPHGNWTCEMQEIPIHATSSLDQDAQSYPGANAFVKH